MLRRKWGAYPTEGALKPYPARFEDHVATLQLLPVTTGQQRSFVQITLEFKTELHVSPMTRNLARLLTQQRGGGLDQQHLPTCTRLRNTHSMRRAALRSGRVQALSLRLSLLHTMRFAACKPLLGAGMPSRLLDDCCTPTMQATCCAQAQQLMYETMTAWAAATIQGLVSAFALPKEMPLPPGYKARSLPHMGASARADLLAGRIPSVSRTHRLALQRQLPGSSTHPTAERLASLPLPSPLEPEHVDHTPNGACPAKPPLLWQHQASAFPAGSQGQASQEAGHSSSCAQIHSLLSAVGRVLTGSALIR